MNLLGSPTYRGDLDAVAGVVRWVDLQDTHLVLSGASGMIGSFLVDLVMGYNLHHQLNCTIHALARHPDGLIQRFADFAGHPNLVLTAMDVTAGITGIDEADYVIHAASNTHPLQYSSDPIGTITANVQGTYAMAELAVRTSARRFVFLSTVEIYGDHRAGPERFAETDLGYIDCNTVRAGYPESKRTGEALCQAFRAQHGLDVVIPRLPRVYGPTMRMNDTKAASQFILKAVAGQDIVLKSAGDQHFSYAHVADAASAILATMSRGVSGEAYNVGDPGSDVLLKDLARLVAGTVGREVVFELPAESERRGYSAASVALLDATKLGGLGWVPLYGIEEGIGRTIAVLREIGRG